MNSWYPVGKPNYQSSNIEPDISGKRIPNESSPHLLSSSANQHNRYRSWVSWSNITLLFAASFGKLFTALSCCHCVCAAHDPGILYSGLVDLERMIHRFDALLLSRLGEKDDQAAWRELRHFLRYVPYTSLCRIKTHCVERVPTSPQQMCMQGVQT